MSMRRVLGINGSTSFTTCVGKRLKNRLSLMSLWKAFSPMPTVKRTSKGQDKSYTNLCEWSKDSEGLID